jgi:YVTN family beta-propeller protein
VGLSTNRINGVLAIGLCAVMVAGCSGGGASIGTSATRPQSQSPVLTAQSTKAAKGNVTFTIGIKPKAKTGRITPKYVSPSTQSLQIFTDGANPVVVNLTPFSPNCSPNPTVPGAYICTASLNVPAGNHVFTVTTYDLTGAEGNVLSTNSTGAVYVKPEGATAVPIVLEGVVHYVALLLATTNPAVGTPATIGLTAVAEDADRNFIVGPAPYESPVTLTTTDPLNGPLSKTTLSSLADGSGITANYTGAKVASITYAATATGLAAANVINAVLTPGAATKPQHLYIAYPYGPGRISVFDTANGNAALPAITGGGLYEPWGVAVDASGKLYVSNWNDRDYPGNVLVFDTAHGNAVLPAITGGGLNHPMGIAVDASGKLYVTNGTGSVSVFDTAHGNAVLPAITGDGLSIPLAVAVDTSGKLYVTNFDTNSVLVFDTAHGNAVLPAIGLNDHPYGVAVDASGKLYVGNTNSVLVFDTAHGNAVLPAITVGLSFPRDGLAVDASGKLYLTDGSVLAFDTAHGEVPLPPITGYYEPNGGPWGVAVH